jgi:hypothetical protein
VPWHATQCGWWVAASQACIYKHNMQLLRPHTAVGSREQQAYCLASRHHAGPSWFTRPVTEYGAADTVLCGDNAPSPLSMLLLGEVLLHVWCLLLSATLHCVKLCIQKIHRPSATPGTRCRLVHRTMMSPIS